jgi:hypothetical protein
MRRVGNDNTVFWQGRRLRIPPSPLRLHSVRALVPVHEYLDGLLVVLHGPRRLAPRRLADYGADGQLLAPHQQVPSAAA